MSSDTSTAVIAASSYLNASTAFTAANIVKYDSIRFDKTGSYSASTGLYTVSTSGQYLISITAQSSGANASLYVVKSGTGYSFLCSTGTTGIVVGGSVLIDCIAGDTIGIYTDTTVTLTGVGSGKAINTFSVQRLSGPSVIAATETVSFSYASSTGQTFNNTVTSFVDFPTKNFDTHNMYTAPVGAYSAASGSWATSQPTWTIPVSGKYYVCAQATVQSYNSGTGEYRDIMIYKNGVLVKETQQNTTSSGTFNPSIATSGLIQCNAGDTLTVKFQQIIGQNRNMAAIAQDNFFDLVRVGN